MKAVFLSRNMGEEKPVTVPFKKHEVEDYERKRYRGLDQRIVDWKEKKILRKILKQISKNSMKVLDLPCGYGRFSYFFLERRFPLVSSDFSFYMVKRARDRSSQEGFHNGVVADAKGGLPFKRNSFSVLLSMRFFHHLQSKEERDFILKEFSYVSAEWLILSFYKKTLFHFLQRKLRRKVKKSRTRISMISNREFKEETAKAGFRVVKNFPLFRGIHAHHIVLLEKR